MNGAKIKSKADQELDEYELFLVGGRWLFAKPIGEDERGRTVVSPVWEVIRPIQVNQNQVGAPIFVLVPPLLFAGIDRMALPKDAPSVAMWQLHEGERKLFRDNIAQAQNVAQHLRAAAGGISLAHQLPPIKPVKS